jgi:predicted nuclease of predicted toxin-antitoxin system
LFVDESLSPRIAEWLNETGEHESIHPLHVGWRSKPDHWLLSRCIEQDRVIVTQNGEDFRRLVQRSEIHPGLVILPPVGREGSYRLLLRGLEFVSARGDPMDVMVNHVLDVDHDGNCRLYPLPPAAT